MSENAMFQAIKIPARDAGATNAERAAQAERSAQAVQAERAARIAHAAQKAQSAWKTREADEAQGADKAQGTEVARKANEAQRAEEMLCADETRDAHIPPPVKSAVHNTLDLTDSGFAVIEYDNVPGSAITAESGGAAVDVSNGGEAGGAAVDVSSGGVAGGAAGGWPYPQAVRAQPIAQRAADPIRERFYNMRMLASGNPFARNDARIFYRQAKFMEDFDDDYAGCAYFSMYYPYYQHMGYEQLRTYFTWRASVRRGDVRKTSLSYVFLYLYEILSGAGMKSAAQGLESLMFIWNAYRGFEPGLDGYIPRWLKDYHIYYRLPHSFADFAARHGLQAYYPELYLSGGADDSLALWNGISSYDVTKSKFYIGGNENLLKDCFDSVLAAVKELCAEKNVRFENFVSLGVSAACHWYPFERALFYNWLRQPDRTVEISGGEIYYCRDNRWTANILISDSRRKELAGYLIKKTESCLRQAAKYKYKIDAKPGAFAPEIKKLGVPAALLDKAIAKAVADFQKSRARTVVSVDHANLARIRQEAQGIQDRLTVPEDEFSYEASSAFIQGAQDMDDYGPEMRAPGGWDELKAALTAAELKALSIILGGAAAAGLKAFADENGVMLEVLIDGINEKASDCIGDAILDAGGDISVYGEYREPAAAIAGI